eukprot:gene20651-22689_t
MSATSEVEELQIKLAGFIVPLTQDKLCELCVHFKIPEAEFENETRLGLTTVLISKFEKLISELKEEERESFLHDCIAVVSQMGQGNSAEQEKIKELEANIAALKEKQQRELEAAKERLRAARNETGISSDGSNIASLKSMFRREFRIVGGLGPQGQKDNLSLMSLNRQIEEGLKKGYEEKEVIDGIIRCVSASLPLKDYIEAMRESGLETIKKILRAHFQEKNASELYTSLTNLVQNSTEEPQNFLLRAMNLREKVIFASKAGNAKVRYEPVQCQSMFLHAVETGLISTILRTRMRPHLQKPGVTDAELINELNIAVTEESERNLKLGLGQRGKAKVAQVQSTTDTKIDDKRNDEAFSNKELVAEVRALRGEMVTLRGDVKKRQNQGETQGRRPFEASRKRRRGCEKCQAEGNAESCRHCWKCGDDGHLLYNCKNSENPPRLLSRDGQ